MKDPDLEAYVETIERHLQARSGREAVLSPRDFALARAWHAAGLPLGAVLLGLDEGLQTTATATLAYCRRFVEAAASVRRPPRAPPAAQEPVPLEVVGELLVRLAATLETLPMADAFAGALRLVREVQDLVSVARKPNWGYLRAKLGGIDDAVSAALLAALPPGERAEMEAAAERAVARHRGRLDEAVLADAVDRYVLARARARYDLVRVDVV